MLGSCNIDLAGSDKRIIPRCYRALCWAMLIGLTLAMVIGLYLSMIIFVSYGTLESSGQPGQDGTGQASEIYNNFKSDYYPGVLGQLRLSGGIRHADGM